MPKILKLNKISNIINKEFSSNYTLVDEATDPDGIIVRSFKMLDYAIPSSLLCVARAGAGTNNIPIDKCTEKGVVVFNTPGANANAVKELVLCSLFLCGRKIIEGIKWANTLTGDVAKGVEDGKGAFVGCEILGKTISIIGMGAIGMLVANSAAALGMNVIGYDPFINEEKSKKLAQGVKIETDLIKSIESADYVSLHLPYNDSTKKMINAEFIGKMKNGVNIINCARGELVDNVAIKAALTSGKVNKYVTDFPNEEVINTENVIAIPHLGASSPEAEENCAIMASAQMASFFESGEIKNSVNFPALSMEKAGKFRVTILYNAEGAMETVKAASPVKCAEAKKGALGYIIADFNSDPKSLVEKLKAVNGVLRVRVI